MTRALLVAALCAACAPAAQSTAPRPPAADGKRLVVPMRIEGELGELEPVLPSEAESLRGRIERLRRLQADPDVVGLLIEIGSIDGGLAKVEDLAQELESVRRSGRRVYCGLDGAGNGELFLAARGCDHVAIAPGGSLELTGVAADVLFVRSALASIGLAADVVRSGAYKDAFEPATHDDMSPQMRESLGAVLDDLFATLVEGIAAGRKLDPARVRALVDQGLFTPQEAHAAGLADSVRHPDSLRWLARHELRGKLARRARERPDASADDVGRMVRSLAGEPHPPSPDEPHLALVHVRGVIATSGEGTGGLFDEVASARAIVDVLERARRDDATRAVVLRVDSPGGSASASDLIWRAVHRLRAKKPVVASMSDTAASGGYYVAAPATKILARASTLTGSIGVIAAKVVAGPLAERLGVRVEVLRRGAMADLGSPFRAWSPEERAAMQRMSSSTYALFLRRVQAGRGRDLRAVAEGRVWTGRRAVALGLVDSLGGLRDALALARSLGRLPEDCPVEVLPAPATLLERFLGRPEGHAELLALMPPAVERAAATLAVAGREGLLAALPFSIRIR